MLYIICSKFIRAYG